MAFYLAGEDGLCPNPTKWGERRVENAFQI